MKIRGEVRLGKQQEERNAGERPGDD